MANIRDWKGMIDMYTRLLEQRTGEGLEVWNRRVREQRFQDEPSLRTWLTGQGVSGYAQSLLVMEQFGYPEFLLASADALIDGQYADRPHLKPVYDFLLNAVSGLGEVIIQARKTYVSLVTPRRTFARIQPARDHVNLALRLDDLKPGGRIEPSKIHETMPYQIRLTSPDQVDTEVLDWLRQAFLQNR